MGQNIYDIRRAPKPKLPPMQTVERLIEVGGDVYRIKRCTDRETHRGYVMIIEDATGRPVLVRPAALADQHVEAVIWAWREGVNRGRSDMAAILQGPKP
jgi:hypothetical protein